MLNYYQKNGEGKHDIKVIIFTLIFFCISLAVLTNCGSASGGAADPPAAASRATINGPTIDPDNYQGINNAVAAAALVNGTVKVSDAQTLIDNLTVPANVALQIDRGGLIIDVSGYTLTIKGPFSAGLYQAFSGFKPRQVTFGDGAVGAVYAEWWGVTGTADDVPINDAIASYGSAAGGIVQLLNKTYNLSNILTVGSRHLQGTGWQSTFINQTGNYYAASVGAYGSISDLSITGTSATLGGVNISNSGIGELANLHIQGLTNPSAVAVNIYNSYRQKLNFLYIYNCSTGLIINGVTTFDANKVEIAQAGIKAIKSYNQNVQVTFRSPILESNYDNVVADFSAGHGYYKFEDADFEDNGTGTNPVIFQFGPDDQVLFEHCDFEGFHLAGVSGTLTDMAVNSGAVQLMLTDNYITNMASERHFVDDTGASITSESNYLASNSLTLSELMSAAFFVDAGNSPSIKEVNDCYWTPGGVEYYSR